MPSRTNAQATMAGMMERGTPNFGTPDSPQDMIAGIHARRDHRWLQKTGWSPMQRQAEILGQLAELPEEDRMQLAQRAISERSWHPDLAEGPSRYGSEHDQALGPTRRQREAADAAARAAEETPGAWDQPGMERLLELDRWNAAVARCKAEQSHAEDWSQRHPDPAVAESYGALGEQWRKAAELAAEEVRRIEHPY